MRPTIAWGVAVGLGVMTPACGSDGVIAIVVQPDDRLSNIVEIQVYNGAACARDSEGSVYCWGDQHEAASLGGAKSPEFASTRPRRIEGIEDAVRLGDIGNAFGYGVAVLSSGEVVTWAGADVRPLVSVDEGGFYVEGHRRRVSRTPPMDAWRAEPTRQHTDPEGPFGDYGCFSFDGLLSCPTHSDDYDARPLDLPNYDRLQWTLEPGVRDVAHVQDEEGHGFTPCLLFADGRVECRPSTGRVTLDLPSPAQSIYGREWMTVFMRDGSLFMVDPDLSVHPVVDIPPMESVDVYGQQMRGITRTGRVMRWAGTNEIPEGRREFSFASRPTQVSMEYGSTCALLADGHVQCIGLNEHGECGIGATSERVEHPTYVVAAIPNPE